MATLNGEGTIQITSSLIGDANLAFTPTVSSATAISHIKIRVIFDQKMKKDNRLLDTNNYSVAPVTLGVPVVVSLVSPGAGTSPTYVDLTTTETTGDWDYQVTVTSGSSGPVSYVEAEIGDDNTATFEAIGERPTIKSVEATSINGVNVIFSEPMLDNDYIRNPLKYVFDGGLTVLSVADVNSDTVSLITSSQTPGVIYNLTIG
jgi:hypothetical protein